MTASLKMILKVLTKMSLISVGVDVGSAHGAIAIIDTDMNILHLDMAPSYIVVNKSKRLKDKLNKKTGIYEKDYAKKKWSDFLTLRELYAPYIKNDIVYTVEKVFVRPKEGEVSSFIFGNSLGIHQGQVSYLNPVAFYNPTPQEWKKVMKVTSDKSTSIQMAEDLFQCKLIDYKKASKWKCEKVDDLAEALLLAFYGLMQHLEAIGSI